MSKKATPYKDWTDEEKAAWEAELDELLGHDEDEDGTPTTAAEPKAETAAEKIAHLEKEVADGRKALAAKFSVDTLRDLEAKSAELTTLKKKVEREGVLKDRYRQRYAHTFATDADFERLWETKLRDEALAEEAEQKPASVPHSVYSQWY